MGGGAPSEHVLFAFDTPEPKELTSRLRCKFPDIEVTYHQNEPKSTPSPSLFKDATALVTFNTLPSNPATDAPLLDYVQLFSAGSNHIQDTPLYKHSDVTIATASGIHGPQIAEWVVMTTLVLNHKYKALYEGQKAREWAAEEKSAWKKDEYRKVHDLVGMRLGVLGYGSIGRQVARVGRAMGMDVVAFTASPRKTKESKRDPGFIVPGTGDPDGEIPVEWFDGLDKASLHEFLKQDIDLLLVSVPLTDQTRHMLSTEEFRVLSQDGKKPAFVTNIARGPIVDQAALIEALKDGTVANAALDVTDPEPLPKDSELWDMENVVLTPHVSGVGQAYTERAFQLLEVQLERRQKGEKLINVVKRDRGY